MLENYEKLLARLVKVSGMEKEDLEKKIENKQSKLSGLISREGALEIVSAELGISFEEENSKIGELVPGMRKVNIVGKVLCVFPVRTFTTKNGEEGKVTNLILADETANIKIVLWDTNHIKLVEDGVVVEGKVLEIINGSMRDNEVHMGSFSELKLSDKILEDVYTDKVVKEKSIKDFGLSDCVKTRAFIVQAFDPKFFNVCIECKRKVNPEGENFVCSEHGKVIPEKRALINLVLDDGTESMRSVLFHDCLADMGITELENADLLMQQKQNLLGKEMTFLGDIRMNRFFNRPEFVVEKASPINIHELVEKLESDE
jgi:ssDNA-binding replication factor A large subunit